MRRVLLVGLLAWGRWGCTQVISPEVVTRCPMSEQGYGETHDRIASCPQDGDSELCWL
jgi:hypothetical protein